MCRRGEVVELLRQAGVNVDCMPFGNIALISAARGGYDDVVARMITLLSIKLQARDISKSFSNSSHTVAIFTV
jgi:hypothetical protein